MMSKDKFHILISPPSHKQHLGQEEEETPEPLRSGSLESISTVYSVDSIVSISTVSSTDSSWAGEDEKQEWRTAELLLTNERVLSLVSAFAGESPSYLLSIFQTPYKESDVNVQYGVGKPLSVGEAIAEEEEEDSDSDSDFDDLMEAFENAENQLQIISSIIHIQRKARSFLKKRRIQRERLHTARMLRAVTVIQRRFKQLRAGAADRIRERIKRERDENERRFMERLSLPKESRKRKKPTKHHKRSQSASTTRSHLLLQRPSGLKGSPHALSPSSQGSANSKRRSSAGATVLRTSLYDFGLVDLNEIRHNMTLVRALVSIQRAFRKRREEAQEKLRSRIEMEKGQMEVRLQQALSEAGSRSERR